MSLSLAVSQNWWDKSGNKTSTPRAEDMVMRLRSGMSGGEISTKEVDVLLNGGLPSVLGLSVSKLNCERIVVAESGKNGHHGPDVIWKLREDMIVTS